MRISLKFFCIAYILVLLSTGLGGTYIIKKVNDTLWDTQLERVNTAVNYAADSLMAFANVSYDEISGNVKNDIILQIKDSLDSAVTDVEIYSSNDVKNEYLKLDDNKITSKYIKEENLLLMETVCKLNTGVGVYYLVVYSDFTETQKQCNLFWNSYTIAVISISIISGLLLFALTKKITEPLNVLTRVTDVAFL